MINDKLTLEALLARRQRLQQQIEEMVTRHRQEHAERLRKNPKEVVHATGMESMTLLEILQWAIANDLKPEDVRVKATTHHCWEDNFNVLEFVHYETHTEAEIKDLVENYVPHGLIGDIQQQLAKTNELILKWLHPGQN
jgi:hypothetical protein